MNHAILLVDDDPHLLWSLSRALRREPYTIYTARTADESVTILKAHSVDLIVSDEQMPGMSGTRFLTWVQDVFPDIPRIMLTGNSSEHVKRNVINSGAAHRFFVKPCNADELAVVIREELAVGV